MRKIVLFCLISVFSYHGASLASPSSQNPHKQIATETGVITGVLHAPDGKMLAEYPISLDVFHKEELVLKIPKMTGPAGEYQFKNIFKSPDFNYIISSEYEGKLYSAKPASLGKKESLKEVDLNMGDETLSSGEVALEQSHENCPSCKNKKMPIDEYQILAILLSIGVVGYFIFSKTRKA